MDPLRIAGNASSIFSCVFLIGCASGTNRIQVTHSQICNATDHGKGIVLVLPLTDIRAGDKETIGSVRSAYNPICLFAPGPAVGTVKSSNGPVGELMARDLAEVLECAGYESFSENYLATTDNDKVLSAKGVDAILDGEIRQFWVETMITARSSVVLVVKLRDPVNDALLWTTTLQGSGEGTLWVGSESEFEDFVRQAVDQVLVQALEAFRSDAFFREVNRRKGGVQ